MNSFKIYVSTGNRANNDVRLAVLDLIKKCGLEPVKFSGGKYTPSLMMGCNAIIVVGESFKSFIGKGIYSEIKFALENNKERFEKRIFFVSAMHSATMLEVRQVTGIEHYNVEDWTSQYGIVLLSDEIESLAIQLTKFSKEFAVEKSAQLDAEDIDF